VLIKRKRNLVVKEKKL